MIFNRKKIKKIAYSSINNQLNFNLREIGLFNTKIYKYILRL